MAVGAVRKFPNDTRQRVGIGVDIPFSSGGVFTPNYTTKEAIKNNIINYFLTNPGERPANPLFGGGLRNFIFEQISFENLDFLKEDINTKLQQFFPDVVINEVEVIGNEDQNEVVVNLQYAVSNTGIEDELNLSFQ
jgi:phage baseplate assembly protein W|tara:strand:- start:1137 stop:1544 length:408 start_codon:yes stop_codon:yes gene_type:complete